MFLIVLFTFHLKKFLPVLRKTNKAFASISMISKPEECD